MANTSGRDRQTLTFERQQEFWASGFRGAGWQSERFVEGMANYDRVLRPFVNQIQGEVNPRLLRLGLPMAQRAIDVFRATTALACFLHLPTWPRAFPRRTAVATGSSPRIRYRPAPHEGHSAVHTAWPVRDSTVYVLVPAPHSHHAGPRVIRSPVRSGSSPPPADSRTRTVPALLAPPPSGGSERGRPVDLSRMADMPWLTPGPETS
ncbi:hypothetical protein [Streptomyces misionensis]|uniref:hypothetical protein n=1 Tax=Streptomyces misionensis TaxID=67331 RepID=UPI000A9ACFCA|nr:hypothetical protein [Streptomyces misionensis]